MAYDAPSPSTTAAPRPPTATGRRLLIDKVIPSRVVVEGRTLSDAAGEDVCRL